MKRKRFSTETIIKILQEAGLGISLQELCPKHGISRQTFYNWRNKYGDLEISDVLKLKGLEEENRKLKHLVAELSLDNQVLKYIFKKKFLTPKAKRKALLEVISYFGLSNRHGCRLLNLNRSTNHSVPKTKDDFQLKKADEKICSTP